MIPLIPIWLTAGLIIGGLHAASLWHSARRAGALVAFAGMLRLVIVAIVLFGAALSGGLFPACVGWGIGFAAVAVFYLLVGSGLT